MLDTTLATEFVPGTNLKGDVAGASWSFLLPSRELGRIVCLGAPPLSTLATIARVGRDLAVCAPASEARQVEAAARRRGLENLRVVVADDLAALPIPGGEADLALVADARRGRRLLQDPALLAELARILKPDGLVYFEPGDADASPAAPQGFAAPQRFWLTPLSGEVHTAVPQSDARTISYFFRHGLYSPAIDLRLFRRAERFLSQRGLLSRITRRSGALMGRPEAAPDARPPQYLRTIARDSGLPIDEYRWGLSARSEFNSRKVLFFLFPRDGGPPEYVAKLTRAPAYNARLENECRALRLLYEKGIGTRETLPEVAFFGHHGDLAIVGETAINGAPFRSRTSATADCPYARSGIDWLTDLGAATADPIAATPQEVAEGLGTLLDRFAAIYRPDPAERAFLAEQIATIARSRAAFPLVFQHGDPGTWNVMVTERGNAVFLDWEAAEPQGMPLWDLFYFVRSFGISVARKAGTRDSLKGFMQQFMAESTLTPLLIDATSRYCERSGLDPQLVEALFHTCWMHRALKEATRLPTDRLDQGHYVQLLRLCIAQRSAPTLRRLFSIPPAA